MKLNSGTAPARGLQVQNAAPAEVEAKTDEAKRIVDKMLRCSSRNVIAYSGGKDSRVMAHILVGMGVARDTVADVSLTFEADAKSNVEFSKSLGLQVTHVDRFGLDWIRKRPEFIFADLPMMAKFYYLRQQTTIAMHMHQHKYCGAFIGRRTQENTVPKDVYQKKNGDWVCNPLRNWRYEHIWGYLELHKIPVSPVYQHPAGRINGSGSWVSVSNKQVSHWGYNSFDLVEDYDKSVMDWLATWWGPAIEYRKRGYFPGILEGKK